MRNIAIQQKGQVQEVQVAVKDAAQEAQEARVNCEEANVSQKLLLKNVEKKVKMKVKMKKKKFCSTKSPTNPTNPTYSTNPTTPNGPTNPTNPTYSTNPTKPNDPTNPTNPTYSTNPRSEEHTSELQSRSDLVCRLLLEKKTRHSASR